MRQKSVFERLRESLRSGMAGEVTGIVRRHWKHGVLAGVGLAALLFLLAYFLIEPVF